MHLGFLSTVRESQGKYTYASLLIVDMGLGPTLDFETTSIVHSIAKRKLDDVGIIGVIAQLWSSDTGQSANTTNEWYCSVSPRRGGGGGGDCRGTLAR